MCFSLCTAAFAADEVDSAGGQGVSHGVLTQAQTAFSVTLPTALPVYVDADGAVTTAQNAYIQNNSFGPVEIEAVQITAVNGWSMSEYDTDFTTQKVGQKRFGFSLQGVGVPVDGNLSASHFSTINGESQMHLDYDANIAVQSTSMDETIASVVFTVGWSDQEIICQDFTITKENRDQIGYTGEAAEILTIPASFVGADGVHYNVTKIGSGAFDSCTNLKEVHIPGSIRTIADNAFGSSSSHVAISYPDTTIYIDAAEGAILKAPWGANGATIIYAMPVPQDAVFRYSFNFNSNGDIAGLTVTGVKDKTLQTLSVPETVVTTAGEYAVTQIGRSAFQSNDVVTTISIGENVTRIESNAFHWASSGLESLISINVDADNPSYTSVDGVLYDKDCSTLIVYPSGRTGAYRIPDTVTTVNDYAFQEGKLSTITLGKNVRNGMDYYVDYYMMYSLENIFVDADNPYYSDIDGILFNKDQSVLYKCPERKTGTVTIPSTVTRVGTSAFRSCTGVTRINIYRPSGSLSFDTWEYQWGAGNAVIYWLG